jgi:PAS domain S-box-containing protein
MYVTDENYEIIFANKTLKSMLPVPIEGRKCWEVLSPFGKPCPYCKLDYLKTQPLGEPLVWDNFNEYMGMWVRTNECISPWPDGRNAHIIVATDITGDKKKEEELRSSNEEIEALLADKTENEQRLVAISDNLPRSFVFQFRSDLQHLPRLTYISKGVKELCGMEADEFRNDPLRFVRIFDRKDADSIMNHVRGGDPSFSYETRIIPVGSTEPVWLLFSGVMRRASDGELIMYGLAIDITARKKIEEELRNSQRELIHNAEQLKEIGDNMADSAIYRTHLVRLSPGRPHRARRAYDGYNRPETARRAAHRRTRQGAGSRQTQIDLPGQHEPRDTHPDERHHRLSGIPPDRGRPGQRLAQGVYAYRFGQRQPVA